MAWNIFSSNLDFLIRMTFWNYFVSKFVISTKFDAFWKKKVWKSVAKCRFHAVTKLEHNNVWFKSAVSHHPSGQPWGYHCKPWPHLGGYHCKPWPHLGGHHPLLYGEKVMSPRLPARVAGHGRFEPHIRKMSTSTLRYSAVKWVKAVRFWWSFFSNRSEFYADSEFDVDVATQRWEMEKICKILD